MDMSLDDAVDHAIASHSRPRAKAKPCIGHYVVGYTARTEAICVVWHDGAWGEVDRDVLAAICAEARGAKFRGTIHVHAATTTMGETPGFRFHQEG